MLNPAPLALFTTALILAVPVASGTDILREQRLTDELADSTTDEFIWLNGEGGRFAALHLTAMTTPSHGGVVLLGGPDLSPDSADVLQPLRKRLAGRGWDSLSLQAPVLESDFAADDYVRLLPESTRRIQAAVDYLLGHKPERIMLIGQGFGAVMALRHVAQRSDGKIAAVVLIDLPTGGAAQQTIASDLQHLKIATLDIANAHAPNAEMQRRKRLQKDNPGYRQLLIADSRPGFKDLEELLVNRIHGWMLRSSQNKDDPSPPPAQPTE